jgi:CheY-like chemotaxis protein
MLLFLPTALQQLFVRPLFPSFFKKGQSAMRVLVVDDRPDVRHSLLYMLEACGFDVAEAEDGEKALDVVESQRVEVVLTDLTMPGMDGRELTRKIVGSRHRPRVIVMSGSESLGPAEAQTLGADAVLSKPFTRERLVQTIKETYKRDS